MGDTEEDDMEGGEDESGEEDEGDDGSPRLPDKAMAYEIMTKSTLRMKHTMEAQRLECAQEKEAERLALKSTHAAGAANNVRAILKHRYRNYTAGWRLGIDRNSNHRVEKAEFFQALRRLGVPDDFKAVWTDLAGTRSNVTLADIDSKAARLLSDFFTGFKEKISKDIVDLVNDTDNLRVDKAGFLKRCRKLEQVVSGEGLLDLNGVFRVLQLEAPFVTAADLEWLENYCQRGQKSEPSKTEEEIKQEKQKEEDARKAGGKKAVQELRELLQHKYGGVIKAWRLIFDPEARPSGIPSDDLIRGCQKVGFIGDVETGTDKAENRKKFDNLWYGIAGPKGFVAKLEDLEPGAIRALEGFKRGCIARFGSMSNAFKELTAKDKPLLTRDEFLSWCKEVRFEHGSDKLLWQYLDDRNVGRILMDVIDRDATTDACTEDAIEDANEEWQEMEPLPKIPEHITLVQRAADQNELTKREEEDLRNHRKELLTMLNEKFGSTVRAWRRGIDPQGKGKLSKDEFFVGCAVVGFTGNVNLVWQEMGLKAKSHVRLKDLDPSSGEDIRVFRERCIDAHGTVHDSLGKFSMNKSRVNPKVRIEEFRTLCKNLGVPVDPDRLFKHLDATSRGLISASSLKWLKDVPDSDEKALARQLTKQVELRKKHAIEKRSANATPAKADIVEEQTLKSRDCAKKRGEKKELVEMRSSLLKMLATDYKSVARGWHIALDPDRTGDLGQDDFLTGLERLGYLKQQASDTEISKAERLFHFLKNQETYTINLSCLDRGLSESALEDMQYHLCWRYGSVQTAFEENDPQGAGEMSIADFTYMCQEAKFTSAVHRLVAFLDPEKTGMIDLRLIDQNDSDAAREAVMMQQSMKEQRLRLFKKKRPAYFREAPSPGVRCGVEERDRLREAREGVTSLKDFKKALTGKYGSLQNAWQKLLSPAGEDEIEYDVFGEAFKALGVDGDSEAAWDALELQSGTLSLRELDPSVEQDLTDFHARIKERFGSVDNLIDETDKDGTYKVDYAKFAACCYECQYRRNERRLFEYYGGDYGKKGSKINLGKIDAEALERVKEKREIDEERRQRDEAASKKRLEVQARRKKGLPDELTEEEEEAAQIAKFVEQSKQEKEMIKKKNAARRERFKQQSASGGSGDLDTSSVRSGSDAEKEKKKMQSQPSEPRIRAGADPAKLFQNFLVRKYGTATRAWRVLDVHKQAGLTKEEFGAGLRVSGCGQSTEVLWACLGCQKLCGLKHIDAEAWQLLSTFRNRCAYRLKGLRKVFQASDGESKIRMGYPRFEGICSKIQMPQIDVLFDLLDVKCVGTLTWEEVKFLEDDYRWVRRGSDKHLVGEPLRKQPTPLGGVRNAADNAMRTSGVGHLATVMKPTKVFLPKTNSLPDINPKLRPNWNERHTMFDTIDNKTDQLIHLMKYVKVEDEIRIGRRVRKKLLEVPTEQWLAENMGEIRADMDEDDEWATT